jgi:glycosyltransferase involved in cell wall biosynthesis
MTSPRNLLVFNLAVDADDPILGFTTEWLAAFAARVDRLDVITMRVGRLDLPDNVVVHSAGKERGWSEARRALEVVRATRSVARANPPIGCFAHMNPVFATVAWPVLRRWRIPMTLWWASDTTPAWLRSASRLADTIVTPTPASFPLPRHRPLVIGHGIETSRFPLLPRGVATRIVAIGRVTPAKRVELLLDAVGVLRDRGHDVSFEIVGPSYAARDADYRRRLDARVQELGLDGVVRFSGAASRTELPSVHARADIVVNAAPTGAYDKSTLEAMSSGIPVVLVDPDAPAAAAADAIAAVLNETTEQRAARGRRGRSVVERDHRLEHVVERVLATFGERS